MKQRPGSRTRPFVGIDAGASLVKLAIEHPSGDLRLEKFVLEDRRVLVDQVAALTPDGVALTGGGAAPIQRFLGAEHSTVVDEFSAWAAGARKLLDVGTTPPPERYLLVSIGTGTSIQLVQGSAAQRVGGTALGGGTVLGLGRLLTGAQDFAQLCGLAARGSRRKVDLLLSDVYEGEVAPLADHLTAASFGRLARSPQSTPDPADLAAGIVHLVAENVGLIIGQAAASSNVRLVLLGGSTLVGNPALASTITGVLAAFGCETRVLANGEYAGALGAIEMLRAQP